MGKWSIPLLSLPQFWFLPNYTSITVNYKTIIESIKIDFSKNKEVTKEEYLKKINIK